MSDGARARLRHPLGAPVATRKRSRPDARLSDRLDGFTGQRLGKTERGLAARLAQGGLAAARPEQPLGLIAHTILHAVLGGRRVHVLSFDDQAAQYAKALLPGLATFGIDGGAIYATTPMRDRAAIYARDVVFLSAQEAVMDVLRLRARGNTSVTPLRRRFARMATPDPVERFPLPSETDLCLVIDGDDTLIARSLAGIVLTGSEATGEMAQLTADDVLSVAAQFGADDFLVQGEEVRLTAAGRERLNLVLPSLGVVWGNPARASIIVSRALAALHLWQEGIHFVIQGDAIEVTDALANANSTEPGLNAQTLLERRFRLETAANHKKKTLERIPLRAVLQDYSSVSVLMADLGRHAKELSRDYGLKIHRSASTEPRSEVCLHPRLLDRVLPEADAHVCLVAGSIREAEWLRRQSGLQDITWPVPAQRPEAATPLVLLSQHGGIWPNWGRDVDVLRIRLLPYRQSDDGDPKAALAWLQQARGLHHLRLLLFRWLERRRVEADSALRRSLFEFDRSCRKTVSMLGDRDA